MSLSPLDLYGHLWGGPTGQSFLSPPAAAVLGSLHWEDPGLSSVLCLRCDQAAVPGKRVPSGVNCGVCKQGAPKERRLESRACICVGGWFPIIVSSSPDFCTALAVVLTGPVWVPCSPGKYQESLLGRPRRASAPVPVGDWKCPPVLQYHPEKAPSCPPVHTCTHVLMRVYTRACLHTHTQLQEAVCVTAVPFPPPDPTSSFYNLILKSSAKCRAMCHHTDPSKWPHT